MKLKKIRRVGDLTAEVFSELISDKSIFVQPLGAIEQHGPHLPLNTDEVIATAFAEESVAKYGEQFDVWLLPTMSYTKSNEHAWSPGTIWLSSKTMQANLYDVGRCIARSSSKKLIFLNAHGGNSGLVDVMNRELRLDFGLKTFLVHPLLPADHGGISAASELGMGIHGGNDETSIMLFLRQELVDMDKAVKCVPEKLLGNKHITFGGTVSFGWLSNDLSPLGHIGDPTTATVEQGRKLFEAGVAFMGKVFGEVANFEF